MPGRTSLNIHSAFLTCRVGGGSARQRKAWHKIFIAAFYLLLHGGYVIGHSMRRRISSAPRTPSTVVQFLFEASDLATGVTPKAKRQKVALVKMNLKELSEDLNTTLSLGFLGQMLNNPTAGCTFDVILRSSVQ